MISSAGIDFLRYIWDFNLKYLIPTDIPEIRGERPADDFEQLVRRFEALLAECRDEIREYVENYLTNGHETENQNERSIGKLVCRSIAIVQWLERASTLPFADPLEALRRAVTHNESLTGQVAITYDVLEDVASHFREVVYDKCA